MKNKIELSFSFMMGFGFIICAFEFIRNIFGMGIIAQVGLGLLVVGVLGSHIMDRYFVV